MMNMFLGIFFFSIPFIILFIWMWREEGLIFTLEVFGVSLGTVLGISVCVVAGAYFIRGVL